MDTKQRFWIPNEFVDSQMSKLSPKAIVAFMVLSRNADSHGCCSWGYRTIAKKSGMSLASAQRALAELRRYQFASTFRYDLLSKHKRGAIKLIAQPLSDCEHNGIKELYYGIVSQNSPAVDNSSSGASCPVHHQTNMEKIKRLFPKLKITK